MLVTSNQKPGSKYKALLHFKLAAYCGFLNVGYVLNIPAVLEENAKAPLHTHTHMIPDLMHCQSDG